MKEAGRIWKSLIEKVYNALNKMLAQVRLLALLVRTQAVIAQQRK